MNARNVIVSSLAALVIFIFGIGLGVLYRQGQGNSAVQTPVQVQTMPDSVKVLSSKLVPLITAHGKITKIEGTNLTLVYQSDARVIKVKSDAKVSGVVVVPATKTTKVSYLLKDMKFDDIKVNDDVEISLKVLPDGQIQAFNITILPSVTPSPAK